jgi:hypothetical protein
VPRPHYPAIRGVVGGRGTGIRTPLTTTSYRSLCLDRSVGFQGPKQKRGEKKNQ